ncbi:MAG: hypothetical protein H6705_14825 [Myxococcales bacterium]|nr:hypothetical protein [Myxococcales bacterium]
MDDPFEPRAPAVALTRPDEVMTAAMQPAARFPWIMAGSAAAFMVIRQMWPSMPGHEAGATVVLALGQVAAVLAGLGATVAFVARLPGVLRGLRDARALGRAQAALGGLGWEADYRPSAPRAVHDPQSPPAPVAPAEFRLRDPRSPEATARVWYRSWWRAWFEADPPALRSLSLWSAPDEGTLPDLHFCGDFPQAVAALEPATRAALDALRAARIELADGRLEGAHRVSLLPALTAALSRPSPLAEGPPPRLTVAARASLLDRMETEPSPAWRCTCFAALLDEAARTGDAALAVTATTRARASRRPDLHLAAAVLGDAVLATTPLVTPGAAAHLARLLARHGEVDPQRRASLAAACPAAVPELERRSGAAPAAPLVPLVPLPAALADDRRRINRGRMVAAALAGAAVAAWASYRHLDYIGGHDGSMARSLMLAWGLGITSVIVFFTRGLAPPRDADASWFETVRRALAAAGVRLVTRSGRTLACDPGRSAVPVEVAPHDGYGFRLRCRAPALVGLGLTAGPLASPVPGFRVVGGDVRAALRALTPPLRRALAAVFADGGEVADGVVWCRGTAAAVADGLFAHLEVLATTPPAPAAQSDALLQRMAHDPEPRWRCACFAALLDGSGPDDPGPDAAAAVARAAASPHPELRLAAAVLAAHRDAPVEDAIARLPDREGADAIVAIAAFRGRFDRAALVALGEGCRPLRAAVVAAIERHDALDEPPLLRWLSTADGDEARAIAAALASHGSPAAVGPLARFVAEAPERGIDAAIVTAVRGFERQLRQRLYGESGGALTFADAGGRLALAGGGELSTADDDHAG